MSDRAFYCVADARYFLGAVGLINSLRLVGHTEPIRLLDCGLEPAQRELLEPEVELVAAPDDAPPWLLKTVAPLARPAAASVLIDTDMIATRSLGELFERASADRVVAIRDPRSRHFDAWGEALGFGPARPGPYVSSGLVGLGPGVGHRVLELLDANRDAVDFDRTFWRRNERDYEFLYADQDLLNAILRTAVAAESTVALDARLSATPPYRGLRVRDPASLRCEYRDGTRPFVIHQYVRKPWLEPTFDGAYSRLLRRLLTADDVAVRAPQDDLPPWLRRGARGAATRAWVSATDALRWRLGDRVPGKLATRLEDRRRSREGRTA